jgi:hypothetical protein
VKKSGEILLEMLEESIRLGEVPYKANRRALEAFDIQEDKDKGLKELTVTSSGIDVLIRQLEGFENAARKVVRGYSSAVL